MARYLVTGGAGFIGSHLCDKLLSQGHHVRVIDNLSAGSLDNLSDAVEFVLGDITDRAKLNEVFVGMDGCFHLAAIPSVVVPPELWAHCHATNLVGTVNVFQAAIDAGNIPVFYASSSAIYGDNPNLPLIEASLPLPISPYACDKYAGELYAYNYAQNYHLPVVSARFFNVYGPRQNPHSPYSGVISKFIHQATHHLPLSIYGDGLQTRDFIYVADVVDAILLLFKNIDTTAMVSNVCTQIATSVNDLATSILTATQSTSELLYEPARVFDVKHSLGNGQKLRELGFKPQYDLNQGIMKTIRAN